jgi:diaminopimelate epimerase
MKPLTGRAFWKMSGSGNDFVFFDNRGREHDDLAHADPIGQLCDRRQGVGADGIVLIDSHAALAFGMRYFNRDGTLAEMCGNAALCSVSFARRRAIVAPAEASAGFSFDTVSGPVTARISNGLPEVDMVPVSELEPMYVLGAAEQEGEGAGAIERCVGFARVGVPHVVILVDDVSAVDVVGRGRAIRYSPQLSARGGANVNFVARADRGYRLRTYERGVESETLACGTGAVAVSALLESWGLWREVGPVPLFSSSGRTIFASPGSRAKPPTLRGEGREVFEGRIADL